MSFVTAWFLSTQAKREKGPLSPKSPAPILDLQYKYTSPIHYALQFVSRLLMSPWTFAHLPALLKQHVRADCVRLLVHRLNRMTWCCTCHLSMRFRDRLRKNFILLTLSDHRQPLRERLHIGNQFCRSRLCCRPIGAPRAIYKCLQRAQGDNARPPDVNYLLSDRWKFVLALTSAQIDAVMSDVEDFHAHCKQSSPKGCSAEVMAAKHVLRESRHLHGTFKSEFDEEKEVNAPPPPDDSDYSRARR